MENTETAVQDKFLLVRQYPVEIYGDALRKPTKELFCSALHELTHYMEDGDFIPFSRELIEDLKKNDPATVVEYAIFVLESDKKHAIRPTFYTFMLGAIKGRIDDEKYLSFAEAILVNNEYNLASNAIIHSTTFGKIMRVNLHVVYEDLIEPVIESNDGKIPEYCVNLKKVHEALKGK